MNLNDLRQKRSEAIAAARALVDRAKAETRDLSGDEQAKFDELIAEQESLRSRIEREENLANLEGEMQRVAPRQAGREDRSFAATEQNDEQRAAKQREAFRSYLRFGFSELSAEERSLLTRVSIEGREARALGLGNSAGGYSVPTTIAPQIHSKMLAYGGLRRSRAEQIFTESGAPMIYVVSDDTANTGELLGEGNATNDSTDPSFAAVQLDAHVYSSKVIRVHQTLLDDAGFDVEAHLANIIAERLGRITELHFATGDGTNKPRGVTVGAKNSAVSPDISSGLSAANILDTQMSLDQAYQPNAEWMIGPAVLSALAKLTFAASQYVPVWQPSLAAGAPATISGKPYVVNPSMPAWTTATNRGILYGDFSAYKIRTMGAGNAPSINVVRLVERFAEYGQVGFLAFLRCDADLVDGNAIVYAASQA